MRSGPSSNACMPRSGGAFRDDLRRLDRRCPGRRYDGYVGIRVFLLDDHDLIRGGLRELLEPEPDIEVIGEAGSVGEGLSLMADAVPDVALIDLQLPDGNGIEVCRSLRSLNPEVRCLILTASADDDAVASAIAAGAEGFLLKNAPAPVVLEAIRKVAGGLSLLDPQVTGRILEQLRERSESPGGRRRLTARQEQLLDLLSAGLTNREIAERLHLAEKTVRNYVSDLLAELGLRHRTEAALYAAERKRPPHGD
jgi:two-component system response regulator DevR